MSEERWECRREERRRVGDLKYIKYISGLLWKVGVLRISKWKAVLRFGKSNRGEAGAIQRMPP